MVPQYEVTVWAGGRTPPNRVLKSSAGGGGIDTCPLTWNRCGRAGTLYKDIVTLLR